MVAPRRPAVALAAALVLMSTLVSAAAGGVLAPRQTAPDWASKAVVGGQIAPLSLSKDLLQGNDGWALLLFVPLAFTFVCPTEVRGGFFSFRPCVFGRAPDLLFPHDPPRRAPPAKKK